MWLIFAVLSAVFAAATSILAKAGIEGIDSTVATAIRTAIVLCMSWIMVLVSHSWKGIGGISGRIWLFLVLSGIATGASWLCYFKALQIGDASKVVPVDKMSTVFTIVFACIFFARAVFRKDGCRNHSSYCRNAFYCFVNFFSLCRCFSCSV